MKSKNVFINFVSNKMIHTNKKTNEDGSVHEFANVSFPYSESANGYATVSVNLGQVLPATKKDGTVVDGFKTILLGDGEKIRKVSVLKDAKTKTYDVVEMSNSDIKKEFDTARNEYSKSKKAETAPAVAE